MPVHDWTRVDAGIFHAFHLGWIVELSRSLNQDVLPKDCYALPEPHATKFGPVELAYQGSLKDEYDAATVVTATSAAGPTVGSPHQIPTAEADLEFYRRRQRRIAIRHLNNDHVVAMIEMVSPGNKSNRNALRSFVEKAAELLDQRIHLLIVDLLPPGPRDPDGVHAAIWDEIAAQEYALPAGRPLTVVSYETALTVRAYVRHLAVGDVLPEMPLFLEPNGCVQAPLEGTYQIAFRAMPRRWRRVLEPTA